jgi:hypothetical protein
MSTGAPLIMDAISPGPSEMLAAVFFTFVAAFFLVLGYMDVLRRRADIRRRAVLDQSLGEERGMAEPGWFTRTKSLRFESLSVTSGLLSDVERRSKEKETEASKIKRELLRAGFFGSNAVL